jgi:hypothetical protein
VNPTIPGWSVVFTEGCGLGRISGNGIVQVKIRMSGLGVLAASGCFLADGVAVVPNGDVFVDTDNGNGVTNATGVALIKPDGTARVLVSQSGTH